jgi:DnaJ-domain-containing protein 1
MPPAPSSGNVALDRFSRVFGSLINQRFTGVLRLADGERQFALYWRGGTIVDAESSAPEDQVGRVALEAGLVDAASVSESIRRLAQSPGRTQTEILVEMGVLPGDAATRLSRILLTRRSLRVFGLPTASFVISAERHDRGSGGGPVEARWTLFRGLRAHFDEPRLVDELADLQDRAVKLLPEAAGVIDLFGFADEERIITAYLAKGYWLVHDLVEACVTVPRSSVLAGVAALRAVDALDVQPAAKVQRLRKKSRENPPVQSTRDSADLSPLAAGTPVGPAPTRAGTSLTTPSITTRLPATGSGSAPSLPAPRASGTAPPVPSMFGRSSTSHAALPKASGTGPPSGPQPPAGLTPGGITSAIRDQIAAKMAQIDAGADHFALLEIGRDATSAEVKTAYFNLVKTYHPDKLALVKLESMRPQMERIFKRLADAYAVISDDRRRAQYLLVLAQGGEQVLRRRADEEAATASRIITAEEHFKRGEMAMRREAYAAALEEFQVAVDLNPTEAEHHALLAWAKWCVASDKNSVFLEVKRGLQKALELNNACVPALLHLGQVYGARGEHDRAYVLFQKVLGVNESQVDARREVRLIEMRRQKGDRKGIFDLFRKK